MKSEKIKLLKLLTVNIIPRLSMKNEYINRPINKIEKERYKNCKRPAFFKFNGFDFLIVEFILTSLNSTQETTSITVNSKRIEYILE